MLGAAIKFGESDTGVPSVPHLLASSSPPFPFVGWASSGLGFFPFRELKRFQDRATLGQAALKNHGRIDPTSFI